MKSKIEPLTINWKWNSWLTFHKKRGFCWARRVCRDWEAIFEEAKHPQVSSVEQEWSWHKTLFLYPINRKDHLYYTNTRYYHCEPKQTCVPSIYASFIMHKINFHLSRTLLYILKDITYNFNYLDIAPNVIETDYFRAMFSVYTTRDTLHVITCSCGPGHGPPCLAGCCAGAPWPGLVTPPPAAATSPPPWGYRYRLELPTKIREVFTVPDWLNQHGR